MANLFCGFNPFPWIAVLPAGLSVVLFLSWQNILRRTSAGRYLLALLTFLSLGSFSYSLSLMADSLPDARLWLRVATACLLTLPSLCFLFNESILNPSGVPAKARSVFLWIAVLLVTLHLTTDCFIAGTYPGWRVNLPLFGLGFFPFLACFLVLQILILKDVYLHYRRSPPGAFRSRDRLLLFAWAVGLGGFSDGLAGFGVPVPPLNGLFAGGFIVVSFLLFRRYGLTDVFQFVDLGSLLRFSRDPILLIRIDGIIQYMNLETARGVGCSGTEPLTGKPVNSIFSPETPLVMPDRVERLCQHQNLPPLELRMKTAGDEMLPVRVNLSGVFNRRGEMLGMVAAGRSIRTDLEREEELLRVHRSFQEKIVEVEERTRELTEANRALESNRTAMLNILEDMEESHGRLEDAYRRLSEIDRTKDIFLSSVSHELRTPLTSIRSFSEILLQYPTEEKETQQEFLTIIHQESERLTRLVNDLLDIAKIESGKNYWSRERVNIRETFSTVLQTFSVLAREKQMTLRHFVEADLPDLYVDRDRICQVVYNLLSNSLKFTPPNGSIFLTAGKMPAGPHGGQEGERILIQVKDDGGGIRPEDLPFIFDKFRQGGDRFGEKPQGTGLGLAICREIVQYYGGSIWAESLPGQGCCLSFTLPVPEDATDDACTEPAGEG
jgi:PAS domain S-box-containing protein